MNRILAWVSLIIFTVVLVLASGCNDGSNGTPPPNGISLGMEPNGLTVVAGEQVQLSPVVLNNGVPMENPEVTWGVTGDIGTITDSGLFTAVSSVTSDAPKTGTITLAGYGKSVSIPVTVTVGPLAAIMIVPPGVDLSGVPLGSTVAFSAVGEDALGNRGDSRIAVTPSWSVEGGIGAIDATGLFTALAPGSGKVVATVGELRAEIDVTTVIGPLGSLEIVAPGGVNLLQLTVGDRVAFEVIATNVNGVRGSGRIPVQPLWQVQGDIGTITQDGRFTATNVGQGAVTATVGDTTVGVQIAVTRAFNGTIAFVRQGDGESNLWRMSGDGAVQPLSTGANYFTNPDWSPDGSKLVFMSQGSPLNGVCLMDADGGNPRQLYGSRGQDPAWSPDGSLIALSNGLVASGEIILIDGNGTFVNKLATGLVGNPRYPCWSPDGRYLAFSIPMGFGLTGGIYVMPVDGSEPARQIYGGSVGHIEWNPSQTYIAMSTANQIVGLPVHGGSPVVLVDESNTLQGGFAWSPDGQSIVYGAQVNGKTQLRVKARQSDVTFPLTGDAAASSSYPCWTP